MTGLPNGALAAAPSWAWDLPGGCARRIDAAPGGRWLVAIEGLVWITATSPADVDNPDRWLAAGESLPLPAGTEWVVEGRSAARYALLEAPAQAASRRPGRAGLWFAGLRSMRRGLSLPARV